MLFREVRGGFFQERVFGLKFTVPSFQLAYALLVRHIGRDRLAGYLLPVGLHPESESGIVNTDFSRDLRYRQRVVNNSLSGLLLEFRSKSSASWHCIPFLSRRILLDPLSGNGEAPQTSTQPGRIGLLGHPGHLAGAPQRRADFQAAIATFHATGLRDETIAGEIEDLLDAFNASVKSRTNAQRSRAAIQVAMAAEGAAALWAPPIALATGPTPLLGKRLSNDAGTRRLRPG